MGRATFCVSFLFVALFIAPKHSALADDGEVTSVPDEWSDSVYDIASDNNESEAGAPSKAVLADGGEETLSAIDSSTPAPTATSTPSAAACGEAVQQANALILQNREVITQGFQQLLAAIVPTIAPETDSGDSCGEADKVTDCYSQYQRCYNGASTQPMSGSDRIQAHKSCCIGLNRCKGTIGHDYGLTLTNVSCTLQGIGFGVSTGLGHLLP